MRIGFSRIDITPRVGVELCGFGPYLQRRSTGVRDRLWAKGMTVEAGGARAAMVCCDLLGTSRTIVERARRRFADATGLSAGSLMVLSTHTHSGPNTVGLIGWGEPDQPYLEALPELIARAAIDAVAALAPATIAHAQVPCEGIGYNREHAAIDPRNQAALSPGWRPARPELTDTACHVLRVEREGRVVGVISSFGCHPVVCCEHSTSIHGDFVGVANSLLEAELPGATALFIQGAQGDVNPGFAHMPEVESLRALDAFAARYADAVRAGLRRAQPIAVDRVAIASIMAPFARKTLEPARLRASIAQRERRIGELADPTTGETRNETVRLEAERRILARLEHGEDLCRPIEVQGLRLGPLALLASPFETFQAIKNEVLQGARAPIALVASFANDCVGYAPDHATAARGGYAQDFVPPLYGMLPYANAHDDLSRALLEVDQRLAALIAPAAIG